MRFYVYGNHTDHEKEGGNRRNQSVELFEESTLVCKLFSICLNEVLV